MSDRNNVNNKSNKSNRNNKNNIINDDNKSDMNNKKNNYGTSMSNFKCIGPCYFPDTLIYHPKTHGWITHKTKPFCPINPTYQDLSKQMLYVDQCQAPTHRAQQITKQDELEMLNPQIEFNDEMLLNMYYNILNIGDTITWFNNNTKAPVYTKLRILNCAFNVFGGNMSIIPDEIINIIIEIIEKKKIKYLYKHLNKYIGKKNDTYILINPDANDLDINDDIIPRTNYILQVLCTPKIIRKCITIFLKEHATNIQEIETMFDIMLQILISYVKNMAKRT